MGASTNKPADKVWANAQHLRYESAYPALNNPAGYRKIRLQGKYGEGLYAKVDPEDYGELSQYRWNVNRYGYAIRSYIEEGKPKNLFMHRQIMNPPDHLVTDHINGDRLDNRKANLRTATRAENNRNMKSFKGSSSIYKGVMWDKAKSLWQANLKDRHLGYFDSQEEAAKVYDYFAKKEYKEFAFLNFPDEVMEHYEKPRLNRRNSSGYRGVSWDKEREKWHAYIKIPGGKRITLGRYTDKLEAAHAYNKKSLELYGKDAFINDMQSEESGADGRI